MTFSSSLALFSAMLVLALVPGPSVLIVCARTVSGGVKSGLATTAGVLSSDYVFIVIAVLGLSALAELMGQAFLWVKLLGAAYLVYLGFTLIFDQADGHAVVKKETKQSLTKDYIAGMLVTLSNPKAILFYVSFFPAFIDLQVLALNDVLLIMLIATVVLGGVLVFYVWLIQKSRQLTTQTSSRAIKSLSGGVMLASAAWIALREN